METRLSWRREIAAFTFIALLSIVSGDFNICTSYTNAQSQTIAAFSCRGADPFCCGNQTYKHCCNNCSEALDSTSACQSLVWDPTYTIVQCVVLFCSGILVCTVGILSFNGSFDGKSKSRDGESNGSTQRLVIDPDKGYPVQPVYSIDADYPVQPNANPVKYEAGDNSLYPVQSGSRVYETNDGQLQVNYEDNENDNLIVAEVRPSSADTKANKLKNMASESNMADESNMASESKMADKGDEINEDSSSRHNSASSIIVSVKPRAPSPPTDPV